MQDAGFVDTGEMHAPENGPATASDQSAKQSRAESGSGAGIPTDDFVQAAERQAPAGEACIDSLDPNRQGSRRTGGEPCPLDRPDATPQVGKRRGSKASRRPCGGNERRHDPS